MSNTPNMTVAIYHRAKNLRIEIPVKQENITDVLEQVDKYNKGISVKDEVVRIWCFGGVEIKKEDANNITG